MVRHRRIGQCGWRDGPPRGLDAALKGDEAAQPKRPDGPRDAGAIAGRVAVGQHIHLQSQRIAGRHGIGAGEARFAVPGSRGTRPVGRPGVKQRPQLQAAGDLAVGLHRAVHSPLEVQRLVFHEPDQLAAARHQLSQ